MAGKHKPYQEFSREEEEQIAQDLAISFADRLNSVTHKMNVRQGFYGGDQMSANYEQLDGHHFFTTFFGTLFELCNLHPHGIIRECLDILWYEDHGSQKKTPYFKPAGDPAFGVYERHKNRKEKGWTSVATYFDKEVAESFAKYINDYTPLCWEYRVFENGNVPQPKISKKNPLKVVPDKEIEA